MNKTQWQNLKNIGNVYFNIIFAVVFICVQNAKAQMFDDEVVDTSSVQQQVVEQANIKPQNNVNQRRMTEPNNSWANRNRAKTPAKNDVKVNVRTVTDANKQNNEAKIYLYYRDYKVSRGLNGRISCKMRFYIYSTASEKITNIAYRLKWPEIETSISFDNVEPNKPVYYDYALLGNGCYSMDTPPNIIVNRCRIKGFSQKYCSSIIQWTK